MYEKINILAISRLTACHEPRFYPAWQLPTNPAFIPLGGCPRTQHLPRLAARPRAQHLLRLARAKSEHCTKKSRPPLAGDRAPMKKMLAFFHGYPGRWPKAGRGNKKPRFTPLGSCPRAQCLPRLTAVLEPSIYPAWRLLANPAFIPLGALPSPNIARKNPFPACGGRGTHEKNARIFFMGTREGGRRPEGEKNQDL